MWQLVQAVSSCAPRGDGGYEQLGCGPVRWLGRLSQSGVVKSKGITCLPLPLLCTRHSLQSLLDLSLLLMDKVFDTCAFSHGKDM